jgi:hypothetical protein
VRSAAIATGTGIADCAGTKVIETGADLASDVPARGAKQIKGLADYKNTKNR